MYGPGNPGSYSRGVGGQDRDERQQLPLALPSRAARFVRLGRRLSPSFWPLASLPAAPRSGRGGAACRSRGGMPGSARSLATATRVRSSGGRSAPGHPNAAGAARGLRLRRRKVSKHLQCPGSGSCRDPSSSPSCSRSGQATKTSWSHTFAAPANVWKCWGEQWGQPGPLKHPCLAGPCPLQRSPDLSSFQAGQTAARPQR